MKKYFTIFTAFILCMEFSFSLEITELFPNPIGDDNNKEFIELYTPNKSNLSGFIIGDSASNDTLTALFYGTGTYCLIVEEGFAWQEINSTVSIYSAGATIGNNLGNIEDTVFLYNPENILLVELHYTEATEGYSIQNNNGTLQKSIPTPGFQHYNKTEQTSTQKNIVSLSFSLPILFYVNLSLTSPFRIENKHDEKIDALLTSSIFFNNTLLSQETTSFFNISNYKTKDTASFFFPSAGNYTLCGAVESLPHDAFIADNHVCENITVVSLSETSCNRNISLVINESTLYAGQQLDFSLLVDGTKKPTYPFMVSYFIEEISGYIAKDVTNTTNTHVKHWTPKLKKEYGVYRLHATLVDTYCNDTTPTDNSATATLFVFNRFDENPFVSIAHLYLGNDGIAKTGDILRVKLYLYTGNLSRIAFDEKPIRVSVKDSQGHVVSPTTQITPSVSFQEQEITIPLLLDYSCNIFPTKEETYTVVIEGPGNTAKQKFPVRGVNKERCGSASAEYPSYTLAPFGFSGENITNTVTIVNTDEQIHTYMVSSKIYRGPKTYNKEQNNNALTLNPGEEYTLALQNSLVGVEPGNYNTKIEIQKDKQKTIKEFRQELLVLDTSVYVEDPSAHILAFRVLGSFSDEQIPLFIQIEGNETYTLFIESALEERKIPLSTQQNFLFFNITPLRGKNMVVAQLYHNATLLDTAALSFTVLDETIVSEQSTNFHETNASAQALITGYTIYQHAIPFETSFYKTIALLNALLLGIFLIILIYTIKRNREAVQRIFKDQTQAI